MKIIIMLKFSRSTILVLSVHMSIIFAFYLFSVQAKQ